MVFKKGQAVKINSLKKQGEISEALRDGKYRVLIGPFEMTCAEGDLTATEAKPQPKASDIKEVRLPPSPNVSESLDLHGATADEASARLIDYISNAVLAGHHEVQIVHGRGSGRVKTAVHKTLQALAVVKEFKLHEFNEGVTRVFL